MPVLIASDMESTRHQFPAQLEGIEGDSTEEGTFSVDPSISADQQPIAFSSSGQSAMMASNGLDVISEVAILT